MLDGRGAKVEDHPNGNWVGPTLIETKVNNIAYTEEIFGPCLTILTVDTLQEGIDIMNNNLWGNGAAIFTKSGANARKFQFESEAGQIGINVPIPVPLPNFSFTGNKRSIAGDLNVLGKAGVNFFTQWKTVTSKWKMSEEDEKLSLKFPTMN